MLDVRLFRHPGFAGGFLAIVMLFAGSYGWFTLAFQYSGYVLGYSVLGAGLAMVPNALSTLPLAVLSPRMSARWGWRSTTTFSLVFLSFGAAVLAAVGHARAFWPMAVGFFVFGIGLGSGTTAPTQALVDALPAAKQGVASAVNDAAREVGAAIGIAVVGSVFNAAYRTHVASDRSLQAVSGLVAAIRASPAVGLQLAGRLPPAQAATVREAVAGGAPADADRRPAGGAPADAGRRPAGAGSGDARGTCDATGAGWHWSASAAPAFVANCGRRAISPHAAPGAPPRPLSSPVLVR
jgi:MFS family permease